MRAAAGWVLEAPFDAFVTARDERPDAVRPEIAAILRAPDRFLARPTAWARDFEKKLSIDVEAWHALTFHPMTPPPDSARCSTSTIVTAIETWLDVTVPLAATFGARLGPGTADRASAYLTGVADADALFDAAAGTPVLSDAEIGRLNRAALALARFMHSIVNCSFGPEFDRPRRIETRHGTVKFGSLGDDDHTADTDVVFTFDPSGNDIYAHAPPPPGKVRGFADLSGDDRHFERGATIGGVWLALDFGGNDIYEAVDGGQAAAIYGHALAFDAGGDNRYSAGFFAQAAAFGGAAFLIGGTGADFYTGGPVAQAAATAGGIAMLIDLGGSDRYTASGIGDVYDRGGDIGLAQGAGFGLRGRAGGGIAILHDLGGNDVYTAGQFAQGIGYALGVGLLIDEAGDDTYVAARYAQGAGIHGGIGALIDRRGHDSYRLETAVGQGAALDNGVGLLADLGGVDSFAADQLAQGGTNAGGVAALIVEGTARFDIRAPYWGGNWGGWLPTSAFPGYAYAALGPAPELSAPQPGETGGRAEALARAGPQPQLDCPPAGARTGTIEDARAFAIAAPLGGKSDAALARYRAIGAAIDADPEALARMLPARDTAAAIGLREAVRCHLRSDPASNGIAAIRLFETLLATNHSAAPIFASVYETAAAGQAPAHVLKALAAAPSCGLRILAARLDRVYASANDPCWRARFVAHRLSGAPAERFDPLTGRPPPR